jgi:hypothetical protein
MGVVSRGNSSNKSFNSARKAQNVSIQNLKNEDGTQSNKDQ